VKAAPLVCLVALTGIEVDAAAGRISHPAKVSTMLGASRIDGLLLGAVSFSGSVDSDGVLASKCLTARAWRSSAAGVRAQWRRGPEEV